MKRSEINSLIQSAARCFGKHGWTLPPNARWDVTDFGLGDWHRFGLVLVNLADEPEYCEKLMYAQKTMTTPAHAHKKKKEDIICRWGKLAVQVWAGEPAKSADQSLRIPINHEEQKVSSAGIIELEAGSRVTLAPGVYHEFYPISDECIIGEVSTANDDLNDNFFVNPDIGRYPNIEEDEKLEFINTGEPEVANRALDISPDGFVQYKLSVTATFRSDLDLRRFPFDRETLEVRIQSFIWNQDQMVFVPDSARVGFNPRSTIEELTVKRVSTEIRQRELAGWTPVESYSEFVALIEVQRRAAFYLWTVFTPVMLIFLISCTIFAVPIESFNDRIGISLTALLACIAMQFTVSFHLPQISYLTVLDWMFVVTYFCIAAGVLISTVQSTLLANQPESATRLNRLAGLGLPVLFFALMGLCMLF